MLLRNINIPAGLVNGSIGTVIDFDESGYPIVQFRENYILVKPMITEIKDYDRVLASRNQVPLRLVKNHC